MTTLIRTEAELYTSFRLHGKSYAFIGVDVDDPAQFCFDLG